MKKLLLMGIMVLSSISYATRLEVPEDVEKEINKSARSFESSQKINFINWQKRSYLKIQEIGKEAEIPVEEFEKIKNKLHNMYGSNYAKQLQVVHDEINDYRDVIKRVESMTGSEVINEEENKKAKEEIRTLNAVRVPEKILDIYKKSAEELFPNNYLKQKQFLSICIRNYYDTLPILREELNKK